MFKYLVKKDGHVLTGFDDRFEADKYAKTMHAVVVICDKKDDSTQV